VSSPFSRDKSNLFFVPPDFPPKASALGDALLSRPSAAPAPMSSLFGLGNIPGALPTPPLTLGDALGLGLERSTTNALANFPGALPPEPFPFGGTIGLGLDRRATNVLADIYGANSYGIAPPPLAPQPTNALASLGISALAPVAAPLPRPTIRRRVYFSFHYDDVMRVNNVRQAWKIDHPNSGENRAFIDSSLWESRRISNESAIKNLIRGGVARTSAVCVLIGTGTWDRRWVKYEIARSVIDCRGLLAVHINGLNHHRRREPDFVGFNPLDLIGIYRESNDKFFLWEKRWVLLNPFTGLSEWQWHPYDDYTESVPLPRYLTAPGVGFVRPLGVGAVTYNFVEELGHFNLGTWVDSAARNVGR
jgi:hypothetical protein